MKQQLQQQRRRRMYEAYLWEHRQYSWDDRDSSLSHRQLRQEVDLLRDEYEGRVFEDPLYLMQYTINWEDTNAAVSMQSPENDAFLNAENEVYLRKVALSVSTQWLLVESHARTILVVIVQVNFS